MKPHNCQLDDENLPKTYIKHEGEEWTLENQIGRPFPAWNIWKSKSGKEKKTWHTLGETPLPSDKEVHNKPLT